jgi:hypothetical protein
MSERELIIETLEELESQADETHDRISEEILNIEYGQGIEDKAALIASCRRLEGQLEFIKDKLLEE